MRDVSAGFKIEMAKQTLNRVYRRFIYNAVDRSDYPKNYGSTSLDSLRVTSGSVSLELINSDKIWNIFLTDISNLRKVATIEFGLEVGGSPEYITLFTGLGDETYFNGEYLSLQIRDKMTKMLQKKVGSGIVPVDYHSSVYNPADLVWSILTVYGELDNTASKVGWRGSGNDQFKYPTGVATDGTYIYIADRDNHRIVKRKCLDFSYVSKIGSQGVGDDQFNYPCGITTDDTHLYIADTHNNRIVKRKCSDLSYVSKIGQWGILDDEFKRPWDITTDDTHLYIADSWNHRIVKRKCLDTLDYVSKIGSEGIGDDQFDYPYGITTDDTHLYIADSWNHRIVKRKCLDLSYVSKIGTEGTGDDQFDHPFGITTDNTHLYIADSYNNRIVKRKCLDTLDYVSKIGSEGIGDDQFNHPLRIATDDTYLYIADFYNHRIVKRKCSDLSYGAENADIDFDIWYQWKLDCNELSLSLQSELKGGYIGTILEKIAYLTKSIIVVRGDGRFIFYRFVPRVREELYIFNDDNTQQVRVKQTFDEILNYIKCYHGYDPATGNWAGFAEAEDGTSQTNYGKISHTEEDTSIWHADLPSAQEFVNRYIERFKDPTELCIFKTGIEGYIFEPGDLFYNSISFYNYSLDHFEVGKIGLNLNEGLVEMEALNEEQFLQLAFFLDDAYLGLLDKSYNPLY